MGGEISDDDENENSSGKKKKAACEAHKLAEKLPPCARLLVVSTSESSIEPGMLFIVPYTGGIIGRLSECVIHLDDVNVSKNHAKLIYNEDEKSYTIQDLGSRNGTFINSERLSSSMEPSDEYILPHDSRLQIGGVDLLCHVHSGLETCDDCEPGLVNRAESQSTTVQTGTKQDLEKARKRELKKIRQKFGLESHEIDAGALNKAGYQDRAEVRRQTVGVDPVGAKTETASTQVPIANKNKGFQMLSKMGWSQGQALGRNEDAADALIEPISVEMRAGREGLGAEAVISANSHQTEASRKRRAEALEKTRQRYSQSH